MKKEIDDIVLKIENGGSDLKYEDLKNITDLLYKSMSTINSISRISSNYDDNDSSKECALKSIRELSTDYYW